MQEVKAARTIALVIAAALLAASCTTHAGRSEFFGKIEPPEGQVLRYISGSEPESLDPQMSSGQPEARIFIALYEGLAEYQPKTTEPVPAIAERWSVNGDNSEFTFFLRHDAKFSNGDPINARDFVYSIRRGLSPELASRVANLAYDIKYAEGYNNGSSFVRDPATGRFLLASEAAPAEQKDSAAATAAQPQAPAASQAEAGSRQAEQPAKKGEDAAPDTDFHKFINSPDRLIVPAEGTDRDQAFKDNPKLKALVAGKEFVPVRAENVGVEAVDDYTVRITLRQSAPYFLQLIPHQFFRVVEQKVVEKYGVNWTNPENFVGSGAFKLEEHKPYNQLVVVRNPYYWDAQNVHLDKITFYPLDELTTTMNLYKAGDVDATYNHTVPAAWLKSGLLEMKDYMNAPENAVEFYQINTTKPPMNDVRVRKALNMAIDREALAKYRVVTKPNGSITPEGIFHNYPRPKGYELDVEGAKRLLAQAGYKDAAGNFDPKKFPVDQVEITYNTAESNKAVAEFVQSQWKQFLGITVPLHNVEWKTFLDLRSKLDYKGIARAGWVGDYMDPYTYLGIYVTNGGDNGTGWFDPKYVAMLNAANREPDHLKRYEMLARAEAYLLDAAPIIPLLTTSTSWLKKPYVKGLYPNPATLHSWKYVYIEHDQAKWDHEMPDMSNDQLAEKE
jgi:oligopeptide transport system substrate-binding protein